MINNLCDAFNEANTGLEMDPLLLIPMFILDFLCIHPFNDGNGRMSRLLTLLLLYRAGYCFGIDRAENTEKRQYILGCFEEAT